MEEAPLNPPPSPQPASRVPLSYAVAALLIGFLLAQLAGKLAGDIASAIAADGGELSAARVVPPMLASELALVVVSLIAPLVANLSLRESLALHKDKPSVFLAAALGTVMLGPLGDTMMSEFSLLFPRLTLGVVPTLHELASRLSLAVLWPSFALLPGVAEELLFRGVLQGALGRNLRAVLIAGTAFALFHIDPVHVIGVLPLGLFLSWVAYRSSTLVSIFAHVTNNTLAVLSIHSATLDVGYGTGRELPMSWLIGSLLVFACAAWSIAQATRAR
ncbi:MAG TPA: CPBP family intramembrane glutamic endopeptidase [Polyangiales bacterium]|nr:CPBP family intramembrane glutamic endopeptidase [Polyangiales bacterium]